MDKVGEILMALHEMSVQVGGIVLMTEPDG
jgi:hypothetical protein